MATDKAKRTLTPAERKHIVQGLTALIASKERTNAKESSPEIREIREREILAITTLSNLITTGELDL